MRYGRVDEVELYRVVERDYRNVLRYTQLRFAYRLYRAEQNRVAECENRRRRICRIEREFGFEITVVDGETVAANVGAVAETSRLHRVDKAFHAMSRRRGVQVALNAQYIAVSVVYQIVHGFATAFVVVAAYVWQVRVFVVAVYQHDRSGCAYRFESGRVVSARNGDYAVDFARYERPYSVLLVRFVFGRIDYYNGVTHAFGFRRYDRCYHREIGVFDTRYDKTYRMGAFRAQTFCDDAGGVSAAVRLRLDYGDGFGAYAVFGCLTVQRSRYG